MAICWTLGTLTYFPGRNVKFHENCPSGHSVSQLKSEAMSSGIQTRKVNLLLNSAMVYDFIFITFYVIYISLRITWLSDSDCPFVPISIRNSIITGEAFFFEVTLLIPSRQKACEKTQFSNNFVKIFIINVQTPPGRGFPTRYYLQKPYWCMA